MIEYRFLAVGYLCVALNFQINGLGLFLPTTFGYAFITGACLSLSKIQTIYRFAVVPAGIMTLLTFPDLFRGALVTGLDSFDYWLGWPIIILEHLLLTFVVIGLIKEATLKNNQPLQITSTFTFLVAAIAFGCYWFIPIETKPLFLTWAITTYLAQYYLALVCELTYRSAP